MPVINLKGSLDGISKTKKVTVGVEYGSANKTFSSDATLKIQGNTSSRYPKKNYSVQFIDEDGGKNKIKLVDSWGKQSKYCLKANYVDYSQSRNVVSGKLFNQVVRSRNIDDEIGELFNGGVVDGYPVLVYLNGDFLGLYTMNIPKDKWMFGMKDETIKQALLFGDNWADSPALITEIADVNNLASSGWDMEYCSTEDNEEIGTSWVGDSMNTFIRFLIDNDGEDFKKSISQYTDVDRAIDAMIFTYFINARDNTSKNIIWASYDGIKWIPSVYDLDGTWGMAWDGSFPYSATGFTPSESSGNLLFRRLIKNYKKEVTARYTELRRTVLSEDNIINTFSAFINNIPELAYEADAERWPEIPSQDLNNLEQITQFTHDRITYMDDWYGITLE